MASSLIELGRLQEEFGEYHEAAAAGRLRLVDAAAGGDVLLFVLEQCVRQLEDPGHPLVGDPVVDGPVLAARVDEAAPAKACEMVGDLRLRDPEALDELSDGQLALLLEQLEDP